MPERRAASHKGDYGHVLIVAGSRGKSGAAVLAARACLRSGAGLVTVAAPASVQSIIAAGVPEAMTEPLPETATGTLARSAADRILALLRSRHVLAAGPGIGTDPVTSEVVRTIVRDAGRPMVLDADALNILSSIGRATIGSPAVLTPHPGEAAKLLGITVARVQGDRLGAARTVASDRSCTVILKGYRTLVASADGSVRVNSTGNPGMSTGGSGDALTGIAAAWLAQGLSPFDSASLATYAHGLAGDLAAEALGEIALTAGDIISHLPPAYLSMAPGQRRA